MRAPLVNTKKSKTTYRSINVSSVMQELYWSPVRQNFSAKSCRFTNSWDKASYNFLYVALLPDICVQTWSIAYPLSRKRWCWWLSESICLFGMPKRRPTSLHESPSSSDKPSKSSPSGMPTLGDRTINKIRQLHEKKIKAREWKISHDLMACCNDWTEKKLLYNFATYFLSRIWLIAIPNWPFYFFSAIQLHWEIRALLSFTL